MYLGRYRVGEYVPLSCWCRTAAGVPTLPDIAPTARLYLNATAIKTLKIPICDKYHVTGFFLHRLFLGNAVFDAGQVRVVYQYALSSTAFSTEDTFEIVEGGSDDGVGISCYVYRRPQQTFVLVQGEGGRLLKKRNPRL